MSGWLVLLILMVMVVVSVIIIVVTRREETRREAQRRRFELTDSGERVPLAPPSAPKAAPKPIEEIAAFVGTEAARPVVLDETRTEQPADAVTADESAAVVRGRFVQSADGEMLLTTPPFKLRGSIYSKRHGRYALGLIRRLPPWLTVCPKVRLDTIVSPTSPDGRDPDDWREWRRRVRVRSVDLLLVDHRTWEPLLAIMLEREHPTSASKLGAGKDRMIDEVLAAIGLPMIRGTGSLKDDWSAIRPYVEQAMLPSGEDSDREPSMLGGATWDSSAVVKLLRMDDERGGLLD
jgi:hypothetical protein